jgi:hypothetical protein
MNNGEILTKIKSKTASAQRLPRWLEGLDDTPDTPAELKQRPKPADKLKQRHKIEAERPASRASTGPAKSTPQERPQTHPVRLTEGEVAERLRVSPKTLRNWRSVGQGPAFLRIERLIRYRLRDVLDYEKGGWSVSAGSVRPKRPSSPKKKNKWR